LFKIPYNYLLSKIAVQVILLVKKPSKVFTSTTALHQVKLSAFLAYTLQVALAQDSV